jgi:hypothetical protein
VRNRLPEPLVTVVAVSFADIAEGGADSTARVGEARGATVVPTENPGSAFGEIGLNMAGTERSIAEASDPAGRTVQVCDRPSC